MTSVDVVKNKKHQITEVILAFSGGLNATEASSVAEYSLVEAGKKGSFTAKTAKAIKLLSAVYNSANDTVTLTPKKIVLRKKAQLVVDGEAPSGLEDSQGRLIDGNRNGQPGSNAVSIIATNGAATINALTGGSAAVDQLVELGELAALAKPRKP
jgi:hypothetical protein